MSNRSRKDVGPAIYKKIVSRLERHSMSIYALCDRIKLDRSVVARWRTGTTPLLVTYMLVFDELDQLDLDQTA